MDSPKIPFDKTKIQFQIENNETPLTLTDKDIDYYYETQTVKLFCIP